MALGNMAFDSTAVFAPTTVTSANVIIKLFTLNDVVYKRSDAVAGATSLDQKAYKIVRDAVLSLATDLYVQADGSTAADSTVAADIATDEITPDTAAQYPWFYTIQRLNTDGSVSGSQEVIHESLLVTLVGIRTLVDTANDTWTDPTPA